ncbi:hypothetical protein [Streptomyces sp. NPDC093676]|uniref:hypothetical protein n=1 Tax=Streptomyces sp. NPDC093676 TaxID=3366050 RepID=UPI00381604F4
MLFLQNIGSPGWSRADEFTCRALPAIREQDLWLSGSRRRYDCLADGGPASIGLLTNDSPAGLLNWIIERRMAHGDVRDGNLEAVFVRKFLLTTA